ncbi:DUF5709 domain-containing protein [Streptomyces sp. CA2R106]|uniref:DUF5709 domain-containing protein n=1 Tax=Streptomyces sp. CA2R106 TaxID=3120153 RepID=UPI003008EEEE
MSDEARGDDVYQPTDDNEEQQDAAPLDMEDAVGEDDYDEVLDKGWSPPERPLAVEGAGTTAREQREGESLDERLAEEVPDTAGDPDGGLGDSPDGAGEPVDPQAGAERAGRLRSPGQGAERPVDDDTVAEDVGIDGGAASAEEAAVHRVDDPGTDRM